MRSTKFYALALYKLSEFGAAVIVKEVEPVIVIQVTATSHNSESAEHGSSHKTCFEKHWKENVDYFKVENPIVCHDGESIQVEA